MLALTALLRGSRDGRLSVLDWGGALRYYGDIARAALPGIEIDYHCLEVATLAEAGRSRRPWITWHTDAGRLERDFDLVFSSGSIQYMEHWREGLRGMARAGRHLFLTRVPVVEVSPTFPAVQRTYGSTMMHWQFNRRELLAAAADCGLEAVREFETGDRHWIKGAAEECELRGWLFRSRPFEKGHAP